MCIVRIKLLCSILLVFEGDSQLLVNLSWCFKYLYTWMFFSIMNEIINCACISLIVKVKSEVLKNENEY